MDGGFFLCPDAWEFLLPAGVRHLRNAMAVCRKRWDLLTLTPMGCALLPEPAAVTAGILLLPGDCPRSDLRAGTVVTYGLSPRDSITLSSLREPVLCVQRALPLLRFALSSVRNRAFTGSFWRRPVRSTRKPPWLQAASV